VLPTMVQVRVLHLLFIYLGGLSIVTFLVLTIISETLKVRETRERTKGVP